MLKCIYCRGTYELIITSKVIDLIGIEKAMISDLSVYKCNGCGRETYPEQTVLRLQQAQDCLIRNQNQAQNQNKDQDII